MSVGRIIKFSFQDIVRNMSLSFMTVLILILMLLSINTLIIVRVLTDQSIRSVKDQIDVSIYFDPTATDEKIQEVRDFVSSLPEVTEERYLSKDEVLAEFKETYSGNTEIIDSLDELGGNPLGSTLIVKTREPKDYQKIITALSVPEYESIIEAKTFGDTETAIDRIQTITVQVERFTYALTALFAIIAFVIIFNTIRVAIYTQRTEIGIKRLVGATNWFISGPYLVESFIFTVVSVVITSVIAWFTLKFLDPYVSVIFESEAILTNYFFSHILFLIGIQFGAVFLLTLFSSMLAMRRYLRT
ncbi:MAG TPA: permease-like cell division protein FtsX [Candidatus Magasanikbacteria bacterium]|nr:permease-like cell division protein FtsX [Candidatus Magasanikbacteria bacterium]